MEQASSNVSRSSILKPPKPRIPLAVLQPNSTKNDVYDDDDTTSICNRIHRRVSFSGKNSIKLFGIDTEKNTTIWHSSYEEPNEPSDNSMSNTEQPMSEPIYGDNLNVTFVPSSDSGSTEDKDNFISHQARLSILERAKASREPIVDADTRLEISLTVTGLRHVSTKENEINKKSSLVFTQKSKSVHHVSETFYNMQVHQSLTATRVDENLADADMGRTGALAVPLLHNPVSNEVSVPFKSNLKYSIENEYLGKRQTVLFDQNTSCADVEITEALSTSLGNWPINAVGSNYVENMYHGKRQTMLFDQNTSCADVEITEALGTNLGCKPITVVVSNDVENMQPGKRHTMLFDQNTSCADVEITEALGTNLGCKPVTVVGSNYMENMQAGKRHTMLFDQNTSCADVETTEALGTNLGCKPITVVGSNYMENMQPGKRQTMLFDQNTSCADVEITEALGTNLGCRPITVVGSNYVENMLPGKRQTMLFDQNTSCADVEITEALGTNLGCKPITVVGSNYVENMQPGKRQTMLFDQNSSCADVEITEALGTNVGCKPITVVGSKYVENMQPGKRQTMLFDQNTSCADVEITEALGTNLGCKPITVVGSNYVENMQPGKRQTMLFDQNTSCADVEITEALGTNLGCKPITVVGSNYVENMQPGKRQTMLFDQNSSCADVEITEALGTNVGCKPITVVGSNYVENMQPGKRQTMLFDQNTSCADVEITEALGTNLGCKPITVVGSNYVENMQPGKRQTMLFDQNTSCADVEITEALGTNLGCKPITVIGSNYVENMQPGKRQTMLFDQNTSCADVEITEALGTNLGCKPISVDGSNDVENIYPVKRQTMLFDQNTACADVEITEALGASLVCKPVTVVGSNYVENMQSGKRQTMLFDQNTSCAVVEITEALVASLGCKPVTVVGSDYVENMQPCKRPTMLFDQNTSCADVEITETLSTIHETPNILVNTDTVVHNSVVDKNIFAKVLVHEDKMTQQTKSDMEQCLKATKVIGLSGLMGSTIKHNYAPSSSKHNYTEGRIDDTIHNISLNLVNDVSDDKQEDLFLTGIHEHQNSKMFHESFTDEEDEFDLDSDRGHELRMESCNRIIQKLASIKHRSPFQNVPTPQLVEPVVEKSNMRKAVEKRIQEMQDIMDSFVKPDRSVLLRPYVRSKPPEQCPGAPFPLLPHIEELIPVACINYGWVTKRMTDTEWMFSTSYVNLKVVFNNSSTDSKSTDTAVTDVQLTSNYNTMRKPWAELLHHSFMSEAPQDLRDKCKTAQDVFALFEVTQNFVRRVEKFNNELKALYYKTASFDGCKIQYDDLVLRNMAIVYISIDLHRCRWNPIALRDISVTASNSEVDIEAIKNLLLDIAPGEEMVYRYLVAFVKYCGEDTN